MGLRVAWVTSVAAAVALRLWNALAGPLLHGYDAWGHVAYVLFVDLYRALPWADQGWSYFHPPLYYLIGALLARSGDADVVVRGLALVGSAAGLGIAAVAAWLVARARGEKWLSSLAAWVAFTALAFLPVHVYTSPMPGNEMLAAFLGTAMVACFLGNEMRARPSHARDVCAALLAALALLTKASAAVPLAAVALAMVVRAARAADRRRALVATAQRGLRVAVVVALVAGPWYLRNALEFGTPWVTSHDHPAVRADESLQAPGERSWRDYVALPGPSLLGDSRFDAPGLIHSVWGSVYLNTWFDTYRASQFPRWAWPPPNDYPIHSFTLAMAALGLLPTGLALVGGVQMLRDALRRPDATIDLVLSLLALAALVFFVAFTWRVPTFAAVKASYLLGGLSLPFAWALVRGLDAVPPPLAALGRAGVAAVAVASSLVFASGLVLPRRPDNPDIHALRAWFGHPGSARDWFLEPGVAERRRAVELLAAVELGAGEPARARRLLRSVAGGVVRPQFINALATASALADAREPALRMWNEALRAASPPEVLVNRGAVRALEGDLEGARDDLRRALARDPAISVGWSDLAWVESALGARAQADRAVRRADALAGRAPRRFPYGIGNGDPEFAGRDQRWLLQIEGSGARARLRLYRPPRARWGPQRAAAGETGAPAQRGGGAGR